MLKAIRFTDNNFKEEVFDSRISVLVDFWGSWCPPCKMMEPLIDELAEEFSGKIKVGKINVDQNPKTRSMFDIAGVPTFILFKDGRILKREVGARSKQQLKDMIGQV